MKSMTVGVCFLVMLFMCPSHQLLAQPTGWTATGSMVSARRAHTATLLNSGKVLIQGYFPNTGELYDPVSGTFDTTGSTISNHSQGSTATLLADGRVLIVGGTNAQRVAEIYDPVSGKFSLTDSLSTPHSYHTATLLPNGTVLIAAGQDQVAGPQTHPVAELYDPQSGTFSMTDSLTEDRSGHTATLLSNGQVLIVGGIQTTTPGSGIALRTCEFYDTSTGTFSPTQDMGGYRGSSHSATLLNNGLVLVAGGSSGNSSDLYDPAMELWTPTANLIASKRSSHTATLLPNGKVLIAGGTVTAASKSVEIYDPTINTFSETDSMITRRQQHTATLLADGIVLLAGGYDGSANTRLAELYMSDPATNIREGNAPGIPSSFVLSQNYPNPFNPDTRIQYKLPAISEVKIVVYNLKGQNVKTLFEGEQAAGRHSLLWDGTTDAGERVASGVYLLRLTAGNYAATKKMVFVQ